MNLREATEADAPIVRELWEEFCAEVPPPPGGEETWEEEWRDTRQDIDDGLVYLAEDDEGVVGIGQAHPPKQGRAHVELVQVRPRARRQGVAKALLRELVRELKERGAEAVSLDVLTANTAARTAWTRLGFEEVSLSMQAPIDALEQRLAPPANGTGG